MSTTLHWYHESAHRLPPTRYLAWHTRVQWFYQYHEQDMWVGQQQAFTGYSDISIKKAWDQAINRYIDALLEYTMERNSH